MISYIKILGPPIRKALKELEKIAVLMPEVTMMDTLIDVGLNPYGFQGDSLQAPASVYNYALTIPGVEISQKDAQSIISKSGVSLGDYDFYFDWVKKPTMDEIELLIEKIDEALKPLGCSYTITTRRR